MSCKLWNFRYEIVAIRGWKVKVESEKMFCACVSFEDLVI